MSKYNSTCHFIYVDQADFSQFPITIDYISLATYARLKMADYLPPLERILYLDVDVLVLGSLQELWNIDLGDKYIAACRDSYIEYETNNHKFLLGLSESDSYFNAGVLLINLEKWRSVDVFNLSIKWLSDYKNKIKYQDQDILNGIFKNKVFFLDYRFNFMPHFFERVKNFSLRRINKLHALEKVTKPIVISHFCGQEKSWDKSCKHFKSYYYFLFSKLENFDSDNAFLVKIIYFLKSFIRHIKFRFKFNIY